MSELEVERDERLKNTGAIPKKQNVPDKSRQNGQVYEEAEGANLRGPSLHGVPPASLGAKVSGILDSVNWPNLSNKPLLPVSRMTSTNLPTETPQMTALKNMPPGYVRPPSKTKEEYLKKSPSKETYPTREEEAVAKFDVSIYFREILACFQTRKLSIFISLTTAAHSDVKHLRST